MYDPRSGDLQNPLKKCQCRNARNYLMLFYFCFLISSPDVILCGWLGSTHQLTNLLSWFLFPQSLFFPVKQMCSWTFTLVVIGMVVIILCSPLDRTINWSQPWCNPLWLTGLKASTNELEIEVHASEYACKKITYASYPCQSSVDYWNTNKPSCRP